MKYLIITFGCQMNRSDSERIASVLEQAKLKETLEIKEADFIIINMCSVRQSAVDRVNGIFENTKNQKSIKILTGCVLKKDAKKFAEKFDYVLDIKDLPKWSKILKINQSRSPVHGTASYFGVEAKQTSKFTATIPIMTGCNNFCTYCVVPYTRDRETSRPHQEIICEIEKLIENGYKEIWLLGQNVNSYSDISFSKLLRKINKVPGNFWIRFTSSHPKDFSEELIKTIKECDKVTEYLNLPVQAGDDEILKKMNRPYKIKKYLEIIKKVRKEIPNICISTDVIVGFPGETKKQFQNTAKLFKEVRYDMAYINKYSPRTGTKAAELKDTASNTEKKERETFLNNILKKTALENNRKYIGKEVEALIDARKDKENWVGKTREYKTIIVKSKNNLMGKFIKTKITDATSWGLKGEDVK